MNHPVISPKKLIEVALPLDAINAAAAREKSIRHGHPSTLHLWWARRPLAAARAVIFSQLVHDPEDLWRCQNPGVEPNKQVRGHWTKSRAKLFTIIEELVKWENTTNETVLENARAEIRKSWRETCELNKSHPHAVNLFNSDQIPGLHDPFAGGGAIPLEAQRLGLESCASDLNPIAVLINKATIEIPPMFAGRPPVSRTAQKQTLMADHHWSGVQGLAEDIGFYGTWLLDEAKRRLEHLYQPIEVTAEMVRSRPDLQPYLGQKLTVIAWIWARTVSSPNPAFSHIHVPLASTFMLSTKAGKEAYADPVIDGENYRFEVKIGAPPDLELSKRGTSAGKWSAFRCLFSGVPITYEYIRSEGVAQRLGSRLMAVVVEGVRGRIYLSPTDAEESKALSTDPSWSPELDINYHPRDIKTQIYGLLKYGELFTARQLVALTTLSDLVDEARARVCADAVFAGVTHDLTPLSKGGVGSAAYGDAVAVYLGLAISKVTNICSSIASWMSDRGAFRETFARQAIPMTWDFAEANPFADAGGSVSTIIDKIVKVVDALPARGRARAIQADAASQIESRGRIISTDPPYYDNIGYADLSDYFYVWLRRTLKSVWPDLFATLAVPKAEELVATPYRHGSKEKADKFFLHGMTKAMRLLCNESTLR